MASKPIKPVDRPTFIAKTDGAVDEDATVGRAGGPNECVVYGLTPDTRGQPGRPSGEPRS